MRDIHINVSVVFEIRKSTEMEQKRCDRENHTEIIL